MFRIDPVKGVRASDDVGDKSDTCYGICADYASSSSPWISAEDCTSICDAYIDKERIATFGEGKCYHRWPDQRGVVWNQSPNYFPALMCQSGDVQGSLARAEAMCDSTAYPKSCKEKARRQASVVVANTSQSSKEVALSLEIKKRNTYVFIVLLVFFIGAGMLLLK